MPRLKCVGGPNDGDWVDLDAGPQSVIKTKQITPKMNETYEDPGEGRSLRQSGETERTLYTVRVVKADGAEAVFLAPDGWSSIRAINHLLDD
jgi:hypothetical protein